MKQEIHCTVHERFDICARDYLYTYNDGEREFAVSCRVYDLEFINGTPQKVLDAINLIKSWINK